MMKYRPDIQKIKHAAMYACMAEDERALLGAMLEDVCGYVEQLEAKLRDMQNDDKVSH